MVPWPDQGVRKPERVAISHQQWCEWIPGDGDDRTREVVAREGRLLCAILESRSQHKGSIKQGSARWCPRGFPRGGAVTCSAVQLLSCLEAAGVEIARKDLFPPRDARRACPSRAAEDGSRQIRRSRPGNSVLPLAYAPGIYGHDPSQPRLRSTRPCPHVVRPRAACAPRRLTHRPQRPDTPSPTAATSSGCSPRPRRPPRRRRRPRPRRTRASAPRRTCAGRATRSSSSAPSSARGSA